MFSKNRKCRFETERNGTFREKKRNHCRQTACHSAVRYIFILAAGLQNLGFETHLLIDCQASFSSPVHKNGSGSARSHVPYLFAHLHGAASTACTAKAATVRLPFLGWNAFKTDRMLSSRSSNMEKGRRLLPALDAPSTSHRNYFQVNGSESA